MILIKSLSLLGVLLAISIEPTSAIPGRTTRYWDCCKQSCGWIGNVQGSYTNANSCSPDGYNVIDKDSASICDGGPSVTCNNYQPMIISDTLSYGYAAFSEPGSCCKCYELTFTNTAVAGKKMIVQATNTGGDVGQGQFDLLIPGGGVGLFNGCQPQWGAPADGWGDRYGGVQNRDGCYQLPAQLQQGCFWRFDWFFGADNPSVDYFQVGCPEQILSVSNCRL